MAALSLNSSWSIYSVLRSLCILHGVPVQHRSARALYNWSRSSVDWDHIDLLRLRLKDRGFLTDSGFQDLSDNLGFSPPLL